MSRLLSWAPAAISFALFIALFAAGLGGLIGGL